MGQERLGPSYFFIPLVLGPLNSLVWYVPSLRYTRGLGWRMHCGVEVTESSTNKQHHLSMGPVTSATAARASFCSQCGNRVEVGANRLPPCGGRRVWRFAPNAGLIFDTICSDVRMAIQVMLGRNST